MHNTPCVNTLRIIQPRDVLIHNTCEHQTHFMRAESHAQHASDTHARWRLRVSHVQVSPLERYPL